MNRAALFGFSLLFPLFCGAFYGLTRQFDPLFGYAFALGVYWAGLIGLMIWQRHTITWPARPFWSSRVVTLLQFIMIGGVAITVGLALREGLVLPFWVFCWVVLFALCNGTLEEVFWRGTALAPAPSLRQACIVLALFTLWHTALLFATGVAVTGGAPGLLAGALVGGAIWTAARMQTRSPAFGIAGHVALNLFAFTELALRNM